MLVYSQKGLSHLRNLWKEPCQEFWGTVFWWGFLKNFVPYHWTESEFSDLSDGNQWIHALANPRWSITKISNIGLNSLIKDDSGFCLEYQWWFSVLFSEYKESLFLFSSTTYNSCQCSRLYFCKQTWNICLFLLARVQKLILSILIFNVV